MELPAAHSERTDSLFSGVTPPFQLINAQLGKAKELIEKQLTVSAKSPAATMRQHGEEVINRLLGHANSHVGKMLRPGLVLLSGKAVGKITDEHIRVAAIVEMIHNSTLLHDDVIDQGQKRRGQPTINSLWGNESAVLLGDFLLSRVFKMCSKLNPRIIKEIATTAARICEGELRQITQKQNHRLSELEYIEIITQKSASLFSSCCRLGGLLAGANEKQIRALADFGLNAGIAFQITDDLLDIIGDESKMGKTLGSDVGKNKLTLPVIHLLKTIDERKKSKIIEKLNAKRYTLNADFVELLRSYGSLEYARSRAQDFVTKAIAALESLKDSNAKLALIETAKFMADRTI